MKTLKKDILKNHPHIYKYLNGSDNVWISIYGEIMYVWDGNIYRYKPRVNNCGYYRVRLYIDGKYKENSVHRLVAKAFIPNPDNKPQVNHIDGNKANNSAENLEWTTHRENMKHASKNGLLKGARKIRISNT